jgi:long-chain-fatty-acid--CoA ligase ACSBG
MKGENTGFGFKFFEKLVFNRVKSQLGLDHAIRLFSGAAPMPKKTADFFFSLNMFINNVFGMSETSGPMTGLQKENFQHYDLKSAGVALPGSEALIVKGDANSECGELCFRGRNIFMGYLKNEIATREAIDSQRRVHSGDEGKINENGIVFITGRIKELLVTAAGENVAPVPIEANVREELPFISNVMLIGDHKKFVSALFTFKVTSAPNEPPNYDLLPEAIEELEKRGVKGLKTVHEAIKSPAVAKLIQAGIDAANKKAISNAARIKGWFLVPNDFSVPGGEFTPTMKVKRKVVTEKYAKEINEIYSRQDL